MKERVLWLCDITTNSHICFVVKMETSYHTRIGNPSGKEILGFIFLRLELTIWWPGSGSCLCDGAMPSNRVSSQVTRVQCSVQPEKHYFNVNRVLKRDFVVGKIWILSKV